jgi:hypothetical protein
MFTAMDTQFIPTLRANRLLPDIGANLEADDEGPNLTSAEIENKSSTARCVKRPARSYRERFDALLKFSVMAKALLRCNARLSTTKGVDRSVSGGYMVFNFSNS